MAPPMPDLLRSLRRSGALPWLIIGVMGALLRLTGLEARPLDGSEAAFALRSLHAMQGIDGPSALTSGPLYDHLNTLTFWLFGASDAAARLAAALAGTALVLTPWLLIPASNSLSPLGEGGGEGWPSSVRRRVALTIAGLLAFSPVLVEAARRADPAALTSLLVMVGLCSAIRIAHDSPSWAPPALMSAIGLSLVHDGLGLVGLTLAFLAAFGASAALGRARLAQATALCRQVVADRGAIGLGVLSAVVAGTGLLMHLGGAAYALSGIWTNLAQELAPTLPGAQTWLALIAYAGPLVLLGITQAVLEVRRGDPLGITLAAWAVLLGVLALATPGPDLTQLSMALLPTTFLAGRCVANWNLSITNLPSATWLPLIVSLAAIGIAVLTVADTAGAGRGPSIGVAIGVSIALASLIAVWWQAVAAGAHRPALALLGGTLIAAWSLNGMARASFGGSPAGSEPLRPDQTAPVFRAAFREINVDVARDPSLRLDVRVSPPTVAQWYGRALSLAGPDNGPTFAQVIIAPAQNPPAPAPAGSMRLPWRVRTTVKPDDLTLLGAVRWLVTRHGLLQGAPDDVILTRTERTP